MIFKQSRTVSWMLSLMVVSLPALSTPDSPGVQSKAKSSREQSFASLRDERDTAEKEIRDAEKGLESLTTQQYWLKEEEAAKQDLKELERVKTPPPDELASLRKRVKTAHDNAATTLSVAEVNKAVDQKQDELKGKRREKERIETEINNKIDLEKPKQDFKTTISFYFTILIGLVILGFFVVASLDEVVRRDIFSGQAGIQFITLFSLVIAIILFGITEVLEGKELAALLGGLSGYILGRSTGTKSPSAPAKISSPVIKDLLPTNATMGIAPTALSVQILGTELQLTNSVKFVQGTKDIPVSDVLSNEVTISCVLTLDPNLPKGAYDVIITNRDGGVSKLPQAFTIQ